MADDLATRVRKLLNAHADGVLDDEELAQKLDRLRNQYGAEAVNALLGAASPVAPDGTTQIITGQATVPVAIAGSHYGHIFINGYRERSRAAARAPSYPTLRVLTRADNV